LHKQWVDEDVKACWFQLFLEYTGNNKQPKDDLPWQLLLVDGHSSNWNPDMIEEARKSKVIIFQFPPHLSHVLQPLDSHFFYYLKQEIRKHKTYEEYQQIKEKWDIIKFLEDPLYHACCKRCINISFKNSGV